MNLWMLYPLIGLGIGFGLVWADAIEFDSRVVIALLAWLWPLALPLLIWHGVTVLQWKRRTRRRGPADHITATDRTGRTSKSE